MTDLISHARYLLGVAVALPLIFGILGRAFFFRRDDDDVRHDPDRARREQLDEGPVSIPDPEPWSDEPWPDFPESASPRQ